MESINELKGKSEQPGFMVDGIRHFTGREFIEFPVGSVVLLDVRPDYERARLFDVDNVIACDFRVVMDRLDELPCGIFIVVADAVGLRSREVVGMLMKSGFEHVGNLAGGIVDWERQGLPVTVNKKRTLTGPCMCQLKTRNKIHNV